MFFQCRNSIVTAIDIIAAMRMCAAKKDCMIHQWVHITYQQSL